MQGPEEIERIIAPSLEAIGVEVVRVRFLGGPRPTLQIMAEHSDGRAMTVDDCAEVSRTVSALLDVEDPVRGAYVLEVSSPGIDRPLVRRKDFDRFAGFEARVETSRPIGQRRRFRGTLGGTQAEGVRLTVDGVETVLPFADIERAKLVMTDDLLSAGATRKK